jgi:hypothetical protein
MVLELPDCELSDAGITAIADALPHLTNLARLDMGGNANATAGARALANGLARLCGLRVLSIRSRRYPYGGFN